MFIPPLCGQDGRAGGVVIVVVRVRVHDGIVWMGCLLLHRRLHSLRYPDRLHDLDRLHYLDWLGKLDRLRSL